MKAACSRASMPLSYRRQAYIEDYQAALLKHMVQNRVMYTEADVAPIQLQFPHRALQRSRLGGVAFYPQMLYPGHAVSWEGGNGNLAALVVGARPSLVKISTFNLAKTLLDVNLRVWDLDNGFIRSWKARTSSARDRSTSKQPGEHCRCGAGRAFLSV